MREGIPALVLTMRGPSVRRSGPIAVETVTGPPRRCGDRRAKGGDVFPDPDRPPVWRGNAACPTALAAGVDRSPGHGPVAG